MSRRLLLLLLLASPTAIAFDAATTHAGLTEGAVLASRLRNLLVEQYRRPLGLYELLRLLTEPTDRGRWIERGLQALDRGEGYAPNEGQLPALSWVVAGSVLEAGSGTRERHHFLDPSTGQGLSEGGFFRRFGLRLRAVIEQTGSMRDLFTSGSFDGTGHAANEWLLHEGNVLGLPHFLAARHRSIAAKSAPERESALAESLLIAGALLHVVEDAADPAHARRDWRDDALARQLAARFGRIAVPLPAGPGRPIRHLVDLLHAPPTAGRADPKLLLARAGQGALSALDHLFRGALLRNETQLVSTVALGPGTVQLFQDDPGGRRLLTEKNIPSAASGSSLIDLPTPGSPTAALFSGVDADNDPIVLVAEF